MNSQIDDGRSARPTQPEIIALLSRPESYPDGVHDVERIETHAAIVFLAGALAYKLKRDVKLPYLDFSTVEKRHAVLLQELSVNRAFSPELYFSVLPVSWDADRHGLRVGGAGEALDWLLVMRRFPQSAIFDALASSGQLSRDLLDRLAETIERSHRQALPRKDGGWFESLSVVIGTLEKTFGEPAEILYPAEAGALIEGLRSQARRHEGLLREREAGGFVRRCHGDLHLRNIVLLDGVPKLFDALEFDETLATIDVLYDLAFLLMDLWHRGLKGEANAVLNHYMRGAPPAFISGLALLPFFMSLRAAIRVMTGLHALAFAQDKLRQTAISEIRNYAALASEVLQPAPRRLIAIGGLSGTGKTTIARGVAPKAGLIPGAIHLRTDVERKIMFGAPLDQKLPKEAYTSQASAEVYRRVYAQAQLILATGYSVVIDAVFPHDEHRGSAREAAQQAQAFFRGFWLEAPPEELYRRIAARKGDASDADAAILTEQLKTVSAPAGWDRIDVSGSIETAAAAVDQISRSKSGKE